MQSPWVYAIAKIVPKNGYDRGMRFDTIPAKYKK
jgi:hypothetical protein